ncbi:hypothetical protein ISN44_As12g023440 [Arabidopsis suecica]|uniref:Uncharacterized protein n=1 Tax=Arabidopsis suecica TaxID=45249 RepID=A0A8T1YM25_ARASU|nr:hypothetical protein ISN44_As12g023440 [Arabidopsis suecica]
MRKMKSEFFTLMAIMSLLLAFSLVHGGGEPGTPSNAAVTPSSPTGGSSGSSGSAHGPNWGYIVGDGVHPQEVVMAMVLVRVRHQMEEEKGLDSGLVRVQVQELDLGLAREEEEPQTVVLAMEVEPDTLVKAVAQAVEMVKDLQVVERGANTAKRKLSCYYYYLNTTIHA